MANECIPLFENAFEVTGQTTTAVVGKTFVDITATRDAATGLIKVGTSSAAGRAFGVAAFDAASGGRVTVIRQRGIIIPVTAGGAIAAGALVEVGASGRAVTIAAGVAVGRAVEAGTNGNDVFIELYV